MSDSFEILLAERDFLAAQADHAPFEVVPTYTIGNRATEDKPFLSSTLLERSAGDRCHFTQTHMLAGHLKVSVGQYTFGLVPSQKIGQR